MTAKTRPLEGIDPRAIKALGHPTRLDALRIFNERDRASPNEVAKEMGVDVGHLAHHVRVLRDCDCIELVGTAQRRGAVEHYYRATKRANVTEEIAQALPQSMREGITAEMLTAIFERISTAIDAGTFDGRSERHLSWMPLTLDEAGWKAMIALKAKTLDQEMEIEAESIERMTDSQEEPIRATTVGMLFEMPPGSD